jgi:hypothetical protein
MAEYAENADFRDDRCTLCGVDEASGNWRLCDGCRAKLVEKSGAPHCHGVPVRLFRLRTAATDNQHGRVLPQVSAAVRGPA